MKLTKLFEPTNIGKMQLKNRLVMAPITTCYANSDGSVSQRLLDFYEERAKGGVGLIIGESTYVNQEGKVFPVMVGADDDRLIPGLRSLVGVAHAYDTKIALQLIHGGAQSNRKASGMQAVAPSPIESVRFAGDKPRALTLEEIEAIIDAFVEGVRRVQEAGFDAVEFHGAHGMLIHQFISPQFNHREDEFGGDFQGRMRFITEIIKRSKQKAGMDFPIIVRVSGDEYRAGGLTLEDNKKIARALQEAGADAIHVSAGTLGSEIPMTIQPMYMPRGCLVHLAEGIKQAVTVPVIAVGRINDPRLAERILEQGKADLIAMGRALVADPELPSKAARGLLDDIRTCIACNQGCIERTGIFLDLMCAVNAAVGREKEKQIEPTRWSKKVLVIGGGPAGMEAARVARLRGHEVSLHDEGESLGGQLKLACIPPDREEIKSLTSYLANQLPKLGVTIKLGNKVTPETVNELAPDVVIVATGAAPIIPQLPGVEKKTVVTANDVLLGKAKVGNRVVVVGGGMVGVEIAEFLVENGKDVTIVEMLSKIGADLGMITLRWYVTQRLKSKNVKMLTNAWVVKIVDEGIVISRSQAEETIEEETLEADSVVLAMGSHPRNELWQQLEGQVGELYKVGDCVEPRKIMEAIHEGYEVGRTI